MAKGSNRQKASRQERRQGRREDRQQANQRLNTRAVNDVQLMNQGPIDTIEAQLQQAQEDYLRMSQQAQSAGGGAADAIAGVETPDFGALADQLGGWINGLAPELRGNDLMGFSPQEAAAGSALGGAIGTTGFNNLANDASRFGMSQAASQDEAATWTRNTQDTIMQRMEDALQGYNDQLRGITAQEPFQISSRLDELRDRRLEQQALREKMANDRAFSEWMQNYLGGQMGGGNPGRLGPGGGGNPGGGLGPNTRPSGAQDLPGQGTVSHAAIDNQGMAGSQLNQYPRNAIRNIRQADDFSDIPPWLQNVYENASGHNRWALVKNDPRRAQIFRQTRGAVRPLYRKNESFGNPGWENPFQWGGN